jgi:hypothetical protein
VRFFGAAVGWKCLERNFSGQETLSKGQERTDDDYFFQTHFFFDLKFFIKNKSVME